jgi:hypothetical protein
MANTRISNDVDRLMEQNEMATAHGRWVASVPGPGANAPFMEDPTVRLQKWGANTWADSMAIQERYMRGTAQNPRDCIKHSVPGGRTQRTPRLTPNTFAKSRELGAENTRALCPAWTLRGLETDAWIEPMAPPLISNPFTYTHAINGREASINAWIAHKEGTCMAVQDRNI